MRRLHGGLLTAALLLSAGCGSGTGSESAASEADSTPIDTPTLAVSTEAIAATTARDATLTVMVANPSGAASPGLDAIVSVLLERPDIDVVVVAAAPPEGGTPAPPTTRSHTASGYPVRLVDAPADGVLPAAISQLAHPPDLALVGVVEGATLGTGIDSSPVSGMLAALTDLAVPALVITAGAEHGIDLAGAGQMLRSLLDVHLDDLLEPGARILTVPSCGGGLLRGPIRVPPSPRASSVPSVVCGGPAVAEPEDDVEAHARGFATLVELRAVES